MSAGASRGTAGRARVTARATCLAAPLADLRGSTVRGAVLATFERSAYLDLGGRIIALIAADLAPGPFTIALDDFDALREQGIAGPVAMEDGCLRIGGVLIDLHGAALWDPALPRIGGHGAGMRGAAARNAVIEELLASSPPGSIVPLLYPEPASGPLLEPLARGLLAIARLLDDPAASCDAARAVALEIAGRGPGLTPSGDDLLVGILLALVTWPPLAPPGVRDLLAEAARARTTRISAAYLDAARQGWAAEPWHVLIRGLQRSPAAARAAVRRLVRIGETSGADALTGFCWAWRRLEG